MANSAVKDLEIASRLFVKKGLPVNLIFFVTAHCNLLCRHCFYWGELNKKKSELTLEEIEKISRSLPNLLSVSLTGGEPYLRPDLPEIAEAFECHSNARNMQIPSNGFLVDQTIARLEQLLRKVRRTRVATGVSLDGPEDIHNEVRQNPKSFARALETLAEMRKLQPSFPNLTVGIALTISSANQHRLEEFYRFIEEELRPDAMTITLVRGSPIDGSLKAVDLDIYKDFARRAVRYRRARLASHSWRERLVIAKEEEAYRLIGEAALATRRISPCYGGELIAVLSETGEVRLCEMLDKSMGNVRNFNCDFAKLWRSRQAAEARAYQKKLACQCTYECAMSVNTLFNPRRALRILKNS